MLVAEIASNFLCHPSSVERKYDFDSYHFNVAVYFKLHVILFMQLDNLHLLRKQDVHPPRKNPYLQSE